MCLDSADERKVSAHKEPLGLKATVLWFDTSEPKQGNSAQTLAVLCLFSQSLSCRSYWYTNKAAEVKYPQLLYMPGERIRGFLFFS